MLRSDEGVRSLFAAVNRKDNNEAIRRSDALRSGPPGSASEALWLFYALLQDSIKEIDGRLSVTAQTCHRPCSPQ